MGSFAGSPISCSAASRWSWARRGTCPGIASASKYWGKERGSMDRSAQAPLCTLSFFFWGFCSGGGSGAAFPPEDQHVSTLQSQRDQKADPEPASFSIEVHACASCQPCLDASGRDSGCDRFLGAIPLSWLRSFPRDEVTHAPQCPFPFSLLAQTRRSAGQW